MMHHVTSRHLCALGLAACVTAAPAFAQQQPPAPTRAITNVRGDLYRVQDNQHFTVFYVTPAGIIVGDPINVAAATWLKGELATRFPNQPVRYVLMSHHDFDHAAGARVFDDTAEIVGHENFNAELQKAKARLQDPFAGMDTNRNQILERDELTGPFGRGIVSQDRNGDGNITAVELFADVVPVESTYSTRRTITLGGRSVNLMHPGRWHAEDMTVMQFPAERALFAVDYPPVQSGPLFLVPSAQDHIDSARAVEALDFEILVPGHGQVGTKADAVAYRTYVQDLLAGVQAGIKAGRTVDQIQASLTLDKYNSWPNFVMQKNANIAEVFASLQRRR